MIATEFIAELQKAASMFRWNFVPQTGRMEDRLARPRLRIRGTRNDRGQSLVFEPIGSVCYARTGLIYDEDSWLDAANAIELSMIDAGDLTAAANDRTWREDGSVREPDPYMQSLRKRLAIAVGLGV